MRHALLLALTSTLLGCGTRPEPRPTASVFLTRPAAQPTRHPEDLDYRRVRGDDEEQRPGLSRQHPQTRMPKFGPCWYQSDTPPKRKR